MKVVNAIRSWHNSSESYRLEAKCGNCGSEFQVVLRKGHEHPHNVECPECGASRTYWGSLIPTFEYEGETL